MDNKSVFFCSMLILAGGVAAGGMVFNILFILATAAMVSTIGLPIIRLFMAFFWHLAFKPLQDYVDNESAKGLLGLFKPYTTK